MHVLIHVLVPKEIAKERLSAAEKALDFMEDLSGDSDAWFDYWVVGGGFIMQAWTDMLLRSSRYAKVAINIQSEYITTLNRIFVNCNGKWKYGERAYKEILTYIFNKNVGKFITALDDYKMNELMPMPTMCKPLINICVQPLDKFLYNDIRSYGNIWNKDYPEGGEYIKFDGSALKKDDIGKYWVVYMDCHY